MNYEENLRKELQRNLDYKKGQLKDLTQRFIDNPVSAIEWYSEELLEMDFTVRILKRVLRVDDVLLKVSVKEEREYCQKFLMNAWIPNSTSDMDIVKYKAESNANKEMFQFLDYLLD